MPKQKHVVHVLNDLSTFKTHRQGLIDFLLKETDFKVTILAPDHCDLEQLRSQGYQVEGYPLSRKGINPIHEFRTLWSLFKCYQRLKPDVVHHFTIKPVIYGTLAARRAKVPKIVNSITGLGYIITGEGLLPKILRPLIFALYRKAFNSPRVKVIFQNRDDQKLFLEQGLVTESQSQVIPGSGVDTNKFYPAPPPPAPPYRVVLPARMLWDKGIGEFVEAARMIKQERSDVEFELVGGLDPGNRMAIPEQTIQEWVKEGVVKWRGRVDNMLEVYHNCHIVCLPSYREGVPMALLEAAACGKVIVTTDVPGCRDVADAVGGVLVRAKDIKELYQEIRRLSGMSLTQTTYPEPTHQQATELFSSTKIYRTFSGDYNSTAGHA